jgi:hypothetical protein
MHGSDELVAEEARRCHACGEEPAQFPRLVTRSDRPEKAMAVHRAWLVFLVLLLGAWPLPTAAQDATPAASGHALDLAAMALAPDDVPAGYFDDYSEWWVPGATFAASVLDGAGAPAGLERIYQSFYGNPEQGITIHCFLFEFASPEAAQAGSPLVDAALRPPLPEGTTVGPTHAPGPDIAGIPSETTFVTYDTWAAGGPRANIVADTFKHDRLLAGISVERYTDPPAAGTPVSAVATPVTGDPAQEQLATMLANTLEARITAVLAGQTPSGVDPALSDAVLPLGQLVDATTPVLGGYKAGIDLLRCGICGEANSLLPFAKDARDGFARIVSLGPMVEGEPTPPFVSVAVTAFSSPEAARRALAAIRQAPNDLPTPGPIPRGHRMLAADPTVPLTEAALAFQATSNADDPQAVVDSAGVDFVSGTRLVTVDVQGGLSPEAAMAAAIDLAVQQAACLGAGDPCDAVTLPPTVKSATAT